MSLFQPVRHGLLLGASLLLLGACQRASYSFQPLEARSTVLPPLPAVAALPLPEAAPESAPTTTASPRPRSSHRWHLAATAAWPAGRAPGRQRTRTRALVLAALRATVAKPAADSVPGRQYSRTTALVLAVLNILILPLSFHNFYLGYSGRGALAIALWLAGLVCYLAGFPALFFGTITAISYVGLALLLGWFIWQVSDLVRIATGDLKPRNGAYTQ